MPDVLPAHRTTRALSCATLRILSTSSLPVPSSPSRPESSSKRFTATASLHDSQVARNTLPCDPEPRSSPISRSSGPMTRKGPSISQSVNQTLSRGGRIRPRTATNFPPAMFVRTCELRAGMVENFFDRKLESAQMVLEPLHGCGIVSCSRCTMPLKTVTYCALPSQPIPNRTTVRARGPIVLHRHVENHHRLIEDKNQEQAGQGEDEGAVDASSSRPGLSASPMGQRARNRILRILLVVTKSSRSRSKPAFLRHDWRPHAAGQAQRSVDGRQRDGVSRDCARSPRPEFAAGHEGR